MTRVFPLWAAALSSPPVPLRFICTFGTFNLLAVRSNSQIKRNANPTFFSSSKASRTAFPSLVHLLCRVVLRLFHRTHIVCGEQAFSLSLICCLSIHSRHFPMTFHTPLSEWTSIYLMFSFWSPRHIRPYACLFTERLSPRFHSAYRGCRPHQ